MSELDKVRASIDEIDSQMAELFVKRMEEVAKIAAYKAEHHLPVLDSERETELLEQNVMKLQNPAWRPYYTDFLRGTMRVSKNFQNAWIGEELGSLFVTTAEDGYFVHLKKGILRHAKDLCNLERKVLIVTDDGVPAQYAKAVAEQCKEPYIEVIPQGEASKSFAMLERLCNTLAKYEFTRSDCVVAVGGGVVGDLTGLAAALYMRGIDCYLIPTTLLSQVDSSVGGKTAIDLEGGKNLVGVFRAPKAVLTDPDLLQTLPSREYANGMAEIVKVALTSDPILFEILEQGKENEKPEEVILRAIEVKRWIVERDEQESGLRMMLNFGHTIGHAIESLQKENGLRHGECVALGMIPMCSGDVSERLTAILKRLGLPTKLPLPPDVILSRISADKKCRGDRITGVLVPRIGSGIFCTMSMDEFKQKIRPALERMI